MGKRRTGIGHNTSESTERLRSIIQRVQNVEERIAELQIDKREIYSEAKGAGFDTKTIRRIIAELKIDPAAREESEALFDIYRAALGILDGTPLGRYALERLEEQRNSVEEESGEDKPHKVEDEPDDIPQRIDPDATVEDARAQGAKAAKVGKSVLSNPYPAYDPRRASWDEGWCAASGSDGMDVPDSWKRKPKKKDEEKPEGEE